MTVLVKDQIPVQRIFCLSNCEIQIQREEQQIESLDLSDWNHRCQGETGGNEQKALVERGVSKGMPRVD